MQGLIADKDSRVNHLRAEMSALDEKELLKIIHNRRSSIHPGLQGLEDKLFFTAARMTLHPELSSVVIVNRGYGAYYVAQEFRKRGIQVIMLLPEYDRRKYFTTLADEVIYIQGKPYDLAECREIFLKNILANAYGEEIFGVDPVWGFESENHHFSQLVSDVGMRFLGPNAIAMRALGDKDSARKAVVTGGLEPIPGVDNVTKENVLMHARKMGFPVMLKGTQGGAGTENRKVDDEKGL